jgi:hypothetical protein
MSDTPTSDDDVGDPLEESLFRESRRVMNEVCKEYLDVVVNNQQEILAYAKGFKRNISILEERNTRLQKRIIALEAAVWNLRRK